MTEIVPLDADVIAESLRDFLVLCYGITARKHYPGGSHALRTVPSAGALYPCELYLQCRGAERLPDGIFHFDPERAELRQLATLGADSAATLFLTGRSGNYRPLMLKAGIVGQRIYLAATALGLGCSGIGAFYDEELNDFLACDDMILYALAFGR